MAREVSFEARTGRFDTRRGLTRASYVSRLDVDGFAYLLDHDNHELRARMKVQRHLLNCLCLEAARVDTAAAFHGSCFCACFALFRDA